MMNKNTIDIDEIQATPVHKSTKCVLLSWSFRLFLQLFSLTATIISWYMYNYFITFAVLVLTFVIMGIVRSKLRQSSIPQNQQEYAYTDAQIASWYVQKYFC